MGADAPRFLYMSRELRDYVKFFAAESYPNECLGAILGENKAWKWNATDVLNFAKAEYRTSTGVSSEESEGLVREAFDNVIGFFHSHPSSVPTLSKGGVDDDFDGMEEGEVELIVSVWPSKRKGFCYRMNAYVRTSDKKHRRVSIVVW